MTATIEKLLTPGKGILAADESTKTITKRFAACGLVSTPELNRKYRQMLLTTPNLEEFISGVIMFEETIHQKTDAGIAFSDYLIQRGIVPGVKVDAGLEPFKGTEEEISKGLEGLTERLKEYAGLGLKFTKWRAVFKITDLFPTEAFLRDNLTRMVTYVKLSQEVGLVPIPEPEILLEGNHSVTKCEEICLKVWKLFFEKLKAKGINLGNLILKTSMVLPGKESGIKITPLEVAKVTLRALRAAVPAEVPGIVFLSGGQTPDEATANLNAIAKFKDDVPWQISFSFARALQEEALAAWAGKEENVKKAQEVFYRRARKVSLARDGKL